MVRDSHKRVDSTVTRCYKLVDPTVTSESSPSACCKSKMERARVHALNDPYTHRLSLSLTLTLTLTPTLTLTLTPHSHLHWHKHTHILLTCQCGMIVNNFTCNNRQHFATGSPRNAFLKTQLETSAARKIPAGHQLRDCGTIVLAWTMDQINRTLIFFCERKLFWTYNETWWNVFMIACCAYNHFENWEAKLIYLGSMASRSAAEEFGLSLEVSQRILGIVTDHISLFKILKICLEPSGHFWRHLDTSGISWLPSWISFVLDPQHHPTSKNRWRIQPVLRLTRSNIWSTYCFCQVRAGGSDLDLESQGCGPWQRVLGDDHLLLRFIKYSKYYRSYNALYL